MDLGTNSAISASNELGIYIHVPFCERKCGYCDFYSIATPEPDTRLFRRFVHALKLEIALRREEWKKFASPVTVYLGGGTPSLLPESLLEQIVRALDDAFGLARVREFSIEANPGTVDYSRLAFYRSLGINRLSIGAQAFQDFLLQRLQRIHTARQIEEAVRDARRAGFTNLNLDLIFGIPGQSERDWLASLRRALDLQPEHLSVYNLTYEEGTPFYSALRSGSLTPMQEELEEKLYLAAHRSLTEAGFLHYEISNYARPGMACLHNLGYWNGRSYLGFGPSAHSYDGLSRWWNERNLAGYLEALEQGKLPPGGREELTAQMRREEWLYLRLRQRSGLAKAEFEEITGSVWDEFLKKLRQNLGEKNWKAFFQFGSDRLALTPRGFWF
ncbi:MAG TPA: radical SAM family heme chaperone HemW, partial [Bacteroidetes bacterium]|nr:radical SAM family heme chaperone HemW [Bacteroidota bacterium]